MFRDYGSLCSPQGYGPLTCYAQGKIKVHLSFSSHRQGLALLPVPSLSLSRSRLFDDVRDNFEHGAPRSQRLFDGSLKARRQQAEPAKQLPMTLGIMRSSGNQGGYYFRPKR